MHKIKAVLLQLGTELLLNNFITSESESQYQPLCANAISLVPIVKMTDINDYLITLDNLDLNKILSKWIWLTGLDKQVVALTKAGDMLLQDNKNYLYFLDVGNAELTLVEGKCEDFFNANLPDQVIDEIIFSSLVDKLFDNGLMLKPNQVYSYTKLPILGGNYDAQNMYPLNIYEHYTLTGEIHNKFKDLPDGTHLSIIVTE